MMLLGGPVYREYHDPDSWIAAVRDMGFTAALCPVPVDTDEATIAAYAVAAKNAGIIIAEVGAWSNPLSPDENVRKEALELCKKSLYLADKIGARCCVNISGSRGGQWDGPDASNFTDETWQIIVETVRDVIDSVQPGRTFYTLEPMPWMYPDTAGDYLQLIADIGRESFAVHFDPVNIINSPRIYYNNRSLLQEFFKKLGRYIKSCHAKDIILRDKLTVHLDEVRPGTGNLDYFTYIREMNRLASDIPLIIEHIANEQECRQAAEYINSVAENI